MHPSIKKIGIFAIVLAAPWTAAFAQSAKKPIQIMVMDLGAGKNISKDLVESAAGLITETLDGLGPFKTLSTQDIRRLLAYESDKQLIGCDNASCLAEIGGAIGADYLIAGSLTLLDESYVVQLQLTDVRKAEVLNRLSRTVENKSSTLLQEIRSLSKILVRALLEQQSGFLALTVSEEGATVKIDGSTLGVSPLDKLHLAGGVHSLEVEKTGFVLHKQDLLIDAGQVKSLSVSLIPSREFLEKYQAGASFTRTAAYLSASGAVLLFAGSATFYLLNGKQSEELNRDVRAYNASNVRTTNDYEKLGEKQSKVALYDSLTLGLAAGGIAALVTSTILFLAGDDPDRYDTQISGHTQNIKVRGGLNSLALDLSF